MTLACVFVVIEMILHNAKISIREKRSLKKALQEEVKFYLKFGENVKPVTSEDADSQQAEDEEGKGTPPPIGFILDRKSESRSEQNANGTINSNKTQNDSIGDRKSDKSRRSKSKKSRSTLQSNGRSNTQST